MQAGGILSRRRLLRLTQLVTAALALLASSSARAASTEASSRVGPGVYLTEGSTLADDGPGYRRSSSEAAPRIVGGRRIDISEAPWQVAMTLNPARYAHLGNAFERSFCGGSLITPRLFISAAHCLVDPRTGQFFADGELAAVTGRTQLSSNQGQEIPVSRLFVFTDNQGTPLYTGRSSAWDIAVVELASPSSSPPIKIAGGDEMGLWSIGRRANVTGWGLTKFKGEGSDFLLSAELAIVPNKNCRRSVGSQFDPVTSLCAGVYSGARDSCQGDSGGPLTVPTADGGQRLVGDVQSGFECGRALNPAAYGRLGAEPVRKPLRNAVLYLSGTDVYGSGAQSPTDLTRSQAIENALLRADRHCQRQKACRAFDARKCNRRGGGFRCLVELFTKRRTEGKRRCSQSVFLTAETGEIDRENLGNRRCKDGW